MTSLASRTNAICWRIKRIIFNTYFFPIAFSTLFEKYLKEEDVAAEAVEADAPEAVANGADKNGGGSKGKYDRPGNVKRPKAKKNEVNFKLFVQFRERSMFQTFWKSNSCTDFFLR